jgi:hypothetical protein
MARIGVGDPDAESWSLPNSTVVLPLKFSTHRSPEECRTLGAGARRRSHDVGA